MKKEYDVAVIGMGPSGVFLAYELIQLKKAKNVILIDQGKRVENRNCPIEKTGKCLKCKPNCNITSGFSGAGAFSDGKLLSYHLSLYNEKEENIYLGGNGGSYIKKYMSYQEIKDLLSYTDDVYLKFGADAKLEGMENKEEIKELQAKAKKEDLNLIDIPIRHLGTEKAHELYQKIEDYIEKEVELKFETTVKDIIIEDGKAKGVIIQSANDKEAPEEEIYAKHIVSAVGRKGAKWLDQMCKKHKIKSELGNVDIGIRYELPDKVMEKVNK